MLQVKRFINELMSSNCYVVYDDETKRCLVIDPASEKSIKEKEFIEENHLFLDYIILTHEHTDHTWGVNSLKEKYQNSKLVCSEACNTYAKKASRVYFLLYYDDPDYRYVIVPADIIVKKTNEVINWNGNPVRFILTPGHSYGSMCIEIGGDLFSGDTMMPFKPYFNGRDSNRDDWEESINVIKSMYKETQQICPGHGEMLTLGEWLNTDY